MVTAGRPAASAARRRLLRQASVTGLALLGWPVIGQAEPAPSEVLTHLPQARLQGQSRLRFLGLKVYDARLWVAGSEAPDATALAQRWSELPLALDIRYLRTLKGSAIAERSLQEMQRQGAIDEPVAARWLARMTELFPDVHLSTRLTGVHRPGQSLRFYLNGRLRGEVAEADFARRFLGIWLSPQTSEPAMRSALLGAG